MDRQKCRDTNRSLSTNLSIRVLHMFLAYRPPIASTPLQVSMLAFTQGTTTTSRAMLRATSRATFTLRLVHLNSRLFPHNPPSPDLHIRPLSLQSTAKSDSTIAPKTLPIGEKKRKTLERPKLQTATTMRDWRDRVRKLDSETTTITRQSAKCWFLQ